MKFTPAANANGAGYASFTFQVQDDGGTANGGVDLDQSANTMTINVTPVDDAPTFVIKDANGNVVSSITGQYSDSIGPLTVYASDIDTPGSGISFSAAGLPANLTIAANNDGTGAGTIADPGKATATVSGRLNVSCAGSQPSGAAACPAALSATITAQSGASATSSQNLTINVQREDASVSFDNNASSVTVTNTGGSSAPFTLNLTISEAADGELGKTLSTNGLVHATPITVTLNPVGGGSAVSCTGVTTPSYSPSTSITATATCSVPALAVNVWEIDATIGGNWYTGTGIGVLTVMDPVARLYHWRWLVQLRRCEGELRVQRQDPQERTGTGIRADDLQAFER